MNAKDIKKEILAEINKWSVGHQSLTETFIKEKAEYVFGGLAKKNDLTGIGKDAIIRALCNDLLGLGPLQQYMDDPKITEIMVNGPYKVYIEKGGRKVLTRTQFEDQAHLRYVVEKMITPSGRRIDESSPFVDFSLADGSRVNVIIPPLAVGGSIVTIRKFLRSIGKIEDLVGLGAALDAFGVAIQCIGPGGGAARVRERAAADDRQRRGAGAEGCDRRPAPGGSRAGRRRRMRTGR